MQHGGPSELKTPPSREEQSKPLTNIKSMIKHLLNNGDKTEPADSRQSSTKSNGGHKPPFFKQAAPTKVKLPSQPTGMISCN